MTTSYSAFGSASGHCGCQFLLPVRALVRSDENEKRVIAHREVRSSMCREYRESCGRWTERVRQSYVTGATASSLEVTWKAASDRAGSRGGTPHPAYRSASYLLIASRSAHSAISSTC